MRSVAAVVIAALASASCAAATPRAPVLTPDGVRFTLADAAAASVSVAGNFNAWSTTSHPMQRAASGRLWTAVVALPPGDHLFMFVVNGKDWVVPPLAEEYADDGFGSRNGVVIVRPSER
jgi:1,4-alpha-glucan branching enzyme